MYIQPEAQVKAESQLVCPRNQTSLLQRACACGKHTTDQHGECTECRKKRLGLQRRAVGHGPETAPPIVHDVLRSPGRPLDDATRGFMESRFNHDFSGVRVHTDARAAESARAVNALAYTVGNHVAFGAGQYAPGTSGGRGLLAHELAHTVQQQGNAGLARAALEVGAADGPGEREAVRAARQVTGGQNVAPLSPAGPHVQRLGDLTKVPPGMSCPPANSSPTPPIQSHLFTISSSGLTPSQIVDIENVVTSWHAAGTNPIIRVDGYASTDGTDETNWQLSCDRASAVAREMEAPSSGAPGIPSSHIDVFAQGETSEFSPALEPNRRATITTTSPLPAPVCTHPGLLRILDVQPVFLRTSFLDFFPTGVTWRARFDEAARIWAKVGVVLNELSPVTISTPLKTAGSTDPEINSVLALRSGTGIEFFMVDNDVPGWGGAVTVNLGTVDAKVLLADRGTSNTLLAHEVSHVLGLFHPGDGTATDGEANTIAQPSGSPSTANPTRNTQTNHDRITFPAPVGSTCISPDP
jgi:outer membrane protein OmpA-like peptidoglycan-associated protein